MNQIPKFSLFLTKLSYFWCNITCETCVVRVDTLPVAVDNKEVTPQLPQSPQLESESVCCWERKKERFTVSDVERNTSYVSNFLIYRKEFNCEEDTQ